ncbi:MAG: FtsH protease activity modulator HflK [Desulfovibrio sp.]|uniref:FtsH protease activity modulator HflK n=1 Tax=Desulfovibrio sp. TaxID=885 RepID=UPI0025C0FC7D|nr:FtsH protease activity modulator HflK [Desulfovibrio sp.]MCI7569418.1 FtsH protease activity modulator HflK [Desulfovibrio sp.]
MNWDWDKLQEKKKKQQKQPPRPQRPFFEDDDEPQEEPRARRQPPRGNGGGDGFRLPSLGNGGRIVAWGVAAVIGLWLLSGIYIVNPDEVGVVMRFGKYDRTVGPGPHYALPMPVETVFKPQVSRVLRAEISGGNRFARRGGEPVANGIDMLTGDENIVNVQFSVQYRIQDPVLYLFNVLNPTEMVRSAAEAAMREVIGNNKIEAVITDGKLQIQNDAAVLLQSLLDSYGAGISVIAVQFQGVVPPPEVSAAFNDVTNARENKNRFINQAEAYRNELLPKARGEAAAILNEANAYKATRVNRAQGDAARFEALLEQYRQAPKVTEQRLYYEAMEDILRNATDKVLLDAGAAGKMLPYMALPELRQDPQKMEKR